ALGRWRPKSPDSPYAGGVVVVHRRPESEVLRIRAHLGTSLDAALPSDRHEAAFGPSNDPTREAEVHDRLHVVHAEPMVCNAHAPHEDSRSSPAVHLGEVEHGLPPEAGLPLEFLPGLVLNRLSKSLEACRMVRDERVSAPTFFDHVLQPGVHDRDVRARWP